jgi:hypothetical protein
MTSKYYIREFNTQRYYFSYRAEEGFIDDLSEAYEFSTRSEAVIFLVENKDNYIMEDKKVEIVEIFYN